MQNESPFMGLLINQLILLSFKSVHVCKLGELQSSDASLFSSLTGDCVDNREKKPRKRTNSEFIILMFSPL